MVDKIRHLLNLNTFRLVIMGGLQGSGKSTIAREFEKVGYKVVCPDSIRVDLSKRDNNYTNNSGDLENYSKEAWKISARLLDEYLSSNASVVFDATLTSVKSRKRLIEISKKYDVELVSVYIECPLELSHQRNVDRHSVIVGYYDSGEPIYDRYVPYHVIKFKSFNQILPTYKEGFHEINIIHTDLKSKKIDNIKSIIASLQQCDDLSVTLNKMYDNNELQSIFPTLSLCWDINQENGNHNLKLHDHMIQTAMYLRGESPELFISGLLHDIGKLETKKFHGKIINDTKLFRKNEIVEVINIPYKHNGFINAKKLDFRGERQELLTIKQVDINENANYYQHHIVGAITARRELLELGFDGEFVNKVYEYILHHMDLPFHDFTTKSFNKIMKKLGVDLVKDLMKIRKADKKSSKTDMNYFNNVHCKLENLISNY